MDPRRMPGGEGEQQALAAAAAGDLAMEEYLLRKYQRFVQYKCKPYFLPDGDREDLIQEGMIGLMEAIRCYLPDKNMSFLAFADLCITRQLLTAVKASCKKKNLPLNHGISLSSALELGEMLYHQMEDGIAPDPETVFIRGEELRRARGHIHEHLTEKERQVFEAYLDGYSYKQIAVTLRTDVKSVDNALQRARKKLEGFLRCLQAEMVSKE